MTNETPQRKCTVEFEVHIHRWQEESDLEPQELIDALEDAIEEYFELGDDEEGETIDFEADEALDLGDTEEGD